VLKVLNKRVRSTILTRPNSSEQALEQLLPIIIIYVLFPRLRSQGSDSKAWRGVVTKRMYPRMSLR